MKIYKISQNITPADVIKGRETAVEQGGVQPQQGKEEQAQEMAAVNQTIMELAKIVAIMNDSVTKIANANFNPDLFKILQKDNLIKAIQNNDIARININEINSSLSALEVVPEGLQSIIRSIPIFNNCLAQLTANKTTADKMQAGKNEMVSAVIQSLQSGDLGAFNGSIESFKSEVLSTSPIQQVV